MTRKKINIVGKIISYGESVFVIAEAGVNHNGKLSLALRMVDAAAKAGADAVKFQTFKAEDVTTINAPAAAYQKKNTGKKQSQLDMLRTLELKTEDYPKIIKRCRQRGIMFLSTPHGGFASVDLLQKLKVPALKFGSGDLTNLPLLRYAAQFKKPIILGTGMATFKEVRKAIQTVKKAGNNNIIVLHATSNYPCSRCYVNLRAMQTMMKELDVLVGYSDHTLGAQTAVMAATLGACVIEKHFTLDRGASGPDHKASIEPDDLAQMVTSIKSVKTLLGSPVKRPTKKEMVMLKNARKSLVALAQIKKGELFTIKNLGIKRPGIGLEPRLYFDVIGKKAKRDIKADSLLMTKDYA